MLAFTIQFLIGTSALRSFDYTNTQEARGCQCFDQGICSSCNMKECPLDGGIQYVKGFGTGGTDRLNGYAAWSIKGADEKYYVVKFGGSQTHKEQALLAAQVAHTLHVMTPKQILIDSKSCPSLWDYQSFSQTSFHDDEEKNSFIKSMEDTRICMDRECKGMPNVAVQEHASYLRVSSEITDIERSFWYQAGAISAFDWITGKSDLFNDLSLDWSDESIQGFAEATEINRHNIHFDRRKLIAIDLGINMPAVEWELWDQLLEQIPTSSSAEELTWVKKVLFPMLAMMRADGEHGRVDEFGDFKREDLSGWDRDLSPSLTMLGLSKTIQKALEMLSAAEKTPKLHQFLASLTGMQKANAKESTFKDRLSQNVQRLDSSVTWQVTALSEAGWVCCKVKCSRQWFYGLGRKECKLNSEHVLMKLGSAIAFVGGFFKSVPEEDCNDITSYRLSKNSQDANTNKEAADLKDQYCNCGDVKKQRIKLTNAPRNNCGV